MFAERIWLGILISLTVAGCSGSYQHKNPDGSRKVVARVAFYQQADGYDYEPPADNCALYVEAKNGNFLEFRPNNQPCPAVGQVLSDSAVTWTVEWDWGLGRLVTSDNVVAGQLVERSSRDYYVSYLCSEDQAACAKLRWVNGVPTF